MRSCAEVAAHDDVVVNQLRSSYIIYPLPLPPPLESKYPQAAVKMPAVAVKGQPHPSTLNPLPHHLIGWVPHEACKPSGVEDTQDPEAASCCEFAC
jgi:hypothetical protein